MRGRAGWTLIALFCVAAAASALWSAVAGGPEAERLAREGGAAFLLSRILPGA
ncbi:MAG: hypothetical protein ACE37J_08835 [Pikeienuella sp.]|uniref:hypothetical protein n=1 Tax=Pikeienuella sp. TaxID=2831957 RepID=UPI003919C560